MSLQRLNLPATDFVTGPVVRVRIAIARPPDGTQAHFPAGYNQMPFEAIRHLLSSRPMRRRQPGSRKLPREPWP